MRVWQRVGVILAAIGLGGCQPGAGYLPYPERYDTASGKVAVLAGGPIRGDQDGPADQARFDGPVSLTLATDGGVVVADAGNSTIRRLSKDGRVTTVSQRPSTLTVAPAASTLQPTEIPADRFDDPVDVASDGHGGTYVLDRAQRRICRLAGDGTASVVYQSPIVTATDSSPEPLTLRYPLGLAISPSGTLAVADRDANRIVQITPAGVATVLAGDTEGSQDGQGTAAQFRHPLDLVYDRDGSLLVADAGNSIIRRVTADGTVTTLGGPSATTGVPPADVGVPRGLALGPDGRLYVLDALSGGLKRALRRLDPVTGERQTLWESTFPQSLGAVVGLPFATLTPPMPPPDLSGDGIAVDGEHRVYFLERIGAQRVLRFTPQAGS